MKSAVYTERGGRFISPLVVEIVVDQCAACGILFGMPASFVSERREDRQQFFCPNGHGLSYKGPTPAQQELERTQRALAAARRYEAETAEQLKRERTAHAATKGQLTKARRRADAGVCQHCHRSFQDVRRHMQTKHAEAAAAVSAG